MDDSLLMDRVAAHRARGMRPKEIARALGLRPAQVEPLLRRLGQLAPPVASTLIGCWISAGWSAGLDVPRDRGWDDDGDDTGSGLVIVAVAHELRAGRVAAATFLVDPWCLGVKNAHTRRLARDELDAWRRTTFHLVDGAARACSLELARHLVLGAAAWAETLGFAPHADFATARAALEPWQGPSAIRFGRDGAPCYIQGPHDDPGRVLRVLAAARARGLLDPAP